MYVGAAKIIEWIKSCLRPVDRGAEPFAIGLTVRLTDLGSSVRQRRFVVEFLLLVTTQQIGSSQSFEAGSK